MTTQAEATSSAATPPEPTPPDAKHQQAKLEESIRLVAAVGSMSHAAGSVPCLRAEQLGLGEYLPNVFGAELSGERSTKAEQIAHALASLGITPAHACMVGAREHDVLGASVHGMRAISVTWGFGSRAELEAAGAERVVDTFEQLVEVVHELDTPSPGSRPDRMP